MTAPFISELIRAANEIDGLTQAERARLLQRAAATIRNYRDRIDYSETPANDSGSREIVYELNEMARLISLFSSVDVSAAMRDAAETIRAGRILLDARREIQAETDGRA